MTTDDSLGDQLGDDEPDWDTLSTDELTDLALGDDVWLNAPALSHLADRLPGVARQVATDILRRSDDPLLVASALRALSGTDLETALDYMRRTAPGWPIRILDVMVEILAVDHPVPLARAPELLSQIAWRLSTPANSEEYNLADLFWRRYPELRPTAAEDTPDG